MSITRRTFLTGTALSAFFGVAAPGRLIASPSLPWRNWSGGVVAHPKGRFSPGSEQHLMEFLGSSTSPIRPVGSGHSFTPLVPTDGHIIVIDQLTGLLDHDPSKLQATFAAGTRLGDMGVPLESNGQAMFNLPDIDRQTIAGAIATATHGTGVRFKCLSAYVTDLRLVTATGEVIEINASANPDLFGAARVSLGALGIVTAATFQNQTPYLLKQTSWVDKTETLLADFDRQVELHRHFELFPLTHSDYSIALATDETDEPINNPPPSPEEEAAFDMAMRGWMLVPPAARRPLINALAEQIEPSERVDRSYRILSNIRNNRFNEMEYSVPAHAGADCLREILATIDERSLDVVFPLEYRYVAGDDTWLSMSSGEEPHCAISVHRTASEDYRPLFDAIEPVFWKYEGRPHWGKIHSLSATELTRLYPHFRDFQTMRERLDPEGRLLNPHLRKLFGVT